MKITSFLPSRIRTVRPGWGTSLPILVGVCIIATLQAQMAPPEPPPASQQNAPQQFSPEELDRLLAPIALYPDALVALILPASTVPSDVVLAARYVASNGDPAQLANQPWDESVKSLAHYPEVLKWMDQNLDWTTTVGDAFLDQPADVMNSVQRLRAEALAAGNLFDTPQQQIIKEESFIRIVPAQPDVIYVPDYDPEVVYVQPYSQDFGPLLTFGAGFAVGSWLTYDFDWGRRGIYVGHWHPGWKRDRDWDRGDRDRDWDRGDRDRKWDQGDRGPNNRTINLVNVNSDTARQWQPSASSQRREAQEQRRRRANARFSNVDTPDADRESDRQPRRPGVTGADDSRVNQIPKPSRLDIAKQKRERTRRDSQPSDGPGPSDRVPAADTAPADATREARDRDRKVRAPTTAPDVEDTPAPGGPKSDARDLSREARGRVQDKAEEADPASKVRGKDRKVPKPSVAPSVAGEQETPAPGGGPESDARSLSRQRRGPDQDSAADPRGKDRRDSSPSAAPDTSQERRKPSAKDERGGHSGNLKKQAQNESNNQPSSADAPRREQKKQIEQPESAPSQSNRSERAKERKRDQKSTSQSAPPQTQNKPPQQEPAAQRDRQARRSAAEARQNAPSQPSNAPQGKGKAKGKGKGGEEKAGEKKNKDDN
jgi:Protein of unknown function (DUF3300)